MGIETDTGEMGCCFPLCAIGTALVETGMPVRVAVALADVARAGRRGAGGAWDRPNLDGRSPDGVLGVIESRDAVTAWLDSVAVDATRALVARLGEQIRPAPVEEMTVGQREAWRSDTRMEVAGEIEAATGTGISVAHKLVKVASASPVAVGAMLEQLRAGECSYYRLPLVLEVAGDLPAEQIALVGRVALAPRQDGAPPSHQQFRRRLRREVAKHASTDAEAARRARATAQAARRVEAHAWGDGAGELAVAGAWERVVAARSRVEAIARRFRNAGDERTLDQLRSDVALDLILFGDICTHHKGDSQQDAGSGSRDGGGVRRGHGRDAGDGGAENDGDGAAEDAAEGLLGEYRWLGALPPARVDVVVSLTTLLGLDDGIGEIPGQGFLTAEHVRQVALTAGSVWRRLVADPLTGRAVERSTGSYRPDATMREQVGALDGVCRGPGCTVPATACDLDHVVDFAKGGATAEPNLVDLDRRHHNPKTKGLWTCEKNGDGVVEWCTLIGRRYATHPFDYRQFLGAVPSRAGDPPPWQQRPYDSGAYREPDSNRAQCVLGSDAYDLCGPDDDRGDDEQQSVGPLRVPSTGELDELVQAHAASLLEDALGCFLDDTITSSGGAGAEGSNRVGGEQSAGARSAVPAPDQVMVPRITHVLGEAPPPF